MAERDLTGQHHDLMEGTATVGGAELTWAGLTDVGSVRSVNEDTFLVDPPAFVVADGMGGHEAGDVASREGAEAFARHLVANGSDGAAVLSGVDEANRHVYRRSEQMAGPGSMGTTMVGLVFLESGDVTVFNVGDSRAYVLSGRRLSQLTVDHSLVQELVEVGRITPAEARSHPERNVITRAVGVDPTVAADLRILRPRPGDRYLLCTDGLSGEVTDDDIAETLLAGGSPTEAAAALVDRALRAGGRDNVTVVVLDVLDVFGADEDTAPKAAVATAEIGGVPEELAVAVAEVPAGEEPGPLISDVPDPVDADGGHSGPEFDPVSVPGPGDDGDAEADTTDAVLAADDTDADGDAVDAGTADPEGGSDE